MTQKDKIVYIDEAGLDNRIYRAYGRSIRGKKIYAQVPGKKRERVSMIGGWISRQFIAAMSFKGGCNRDVLNTWLETTLLPELEPGTTIVMDNAAFHKSPRTREIIEAAGCYLKFLPTYSPDLNPIEHCWHSLKAKIKRLVQKAYDNMQDLVDYALRDMMIGNN